MLFLFWNVDQARREEKYPHTKWDVRSDHVKKMINKVNPDVFALVELRNLETSTEPVSKFCAEFPDYHAEGRYYNHYETSFFMCLFVRRSMYYIQNTQVVRLTKDMKDSEIVMLVTVQSIATQSLITIGVTHFGMSEEKKNESVSVLDIVVKERGNDQLLICGDFNFFEDLQGKKQRDKMLETCDDLAYPLYTASGEKLSGTFMGFAHDEHKKTYEEMSRLDHIFTSKIFSHPVRLEKDTKAQSPFLERYQFNNSFHDTYTYPSDHLAICLNIDFK